MTREELAHICRVSQTLSESEYEIFLWMGEGFTCREISVMPGRHRSMKTVDTHTAHLKEKFDVGNVFKLRAYASTYKTLLDHNIVNVKNFHNTTVRLYRTTELCEPSLQSVVS